VFPLQRETNGGMVEHFLVHPDEIEIPSVVLLMAGDALSGPERRVESPFRRDPGVQLLVARKASPVLDRAPELVAGGAIIDPFEGRMRRGEFSGRDLGGELDGRGAK
jgi:hypothetical protein